MTETLDHPIVPPAAGDTSNSFYGREWFFVQLEEWLVQASPSPWLITAEPGWGKSALARQIVARIAGALLWHPTLSLGGETLSETRPPWPRAELDHARLLVIDGLNLSDPRLDLSDWLVAHDFPCPVLLLTRPSRNCARAQASGVRFTPFDCGSSYNFRDVSGYLQRFPQELAQRTLARSHGSFLIASLLVREGVSDLDVIEVMWNVVSAVVQEAPLEARGDLYKMLCLLAEAGEPLDPEQFVDFLGFTAYRTQELLSHLRPLLVVIQRRGYQLFSPWAARAVSSQLLRDMEGTHASVIAFFRETYPSWDEMSDPYGWHHLGHHCERYARTGKKRDFSILHWLTEGPYIRMKLHKTRALPSTLQDIRRGLEAALEERDLPRIIHYGFEIPRMRREMAAAYLHEQADKGELDKAGLHGNLLAFESSRFLAYLLLAWQAADEGQRVWVDRYVQAALHTPVPELDQDDLALVTSICASLLKFMPQQKEDILRLLDLEESPLRAARNYLTLGLLEAVDEGTRREAVERGQKKLRLVDTNEHQTLSHFAERTLAFIQRPRPLPQESPAAAPLTEDGLDEEAFVEAVTALSREKHDDQLVDGLFRLVERVLVQRPDWLHARLPVAVQLMGQVKTLTERLRGLAMLSRFLVYLGSTEESWDIFEKLASVAEAIEESPYRCRALAEVGIGFHRVGQFVRSNQLISQAAAQAFQLEIAVRASVLKFIAGAVAQVGGHARARDLAFNALEIIEGGGGPYLEVHCQGCLRQGVVANISDERSFELLKVYAETLRRQALEPRVKALGLAAIAEGANRLGYLEEARQWQEVAIGIARAAEGNMDRSFMLARLAATEHNLGDRGRYERLLQESMEALIVHTDALHRAEGLMTLAEVRHSVRDPRAHAVERTLYKEMSSLEPSALLHSRTLLRVVAARHLGHFSCDIQELLERARHALEAAEPADRDDALLQHVRLELAVDQPERAIYQAGQIRSLRLRATAVAEIAEATIVDYPQQAIQWLSEIPLRTERLTAILRCNTRLAAELRPSRQRAQEQTLAHLTILATEDESVADVLLSRWIQLTTDQRSLERTARKMGWLPEEPAPSVQPLTLRPLT